MSEALTPGNDRDLDRSAFPGVSPAIAALAEQWGWDGSMEPEQVARVLGGATSVVNAMAQGERYAVGLSGQQATAQTDLLQRAVTITTAALADPRLTPLERLAVTIGMAMHEAGHGRITLPMSKAVDRWGRTWPNSGWRSHAGRLSNIGEDERLEALTATRWPAYAEAFRLTMWWVAMRYPAQAVTRLPETRGEAVNFGLAAIRYGNLTQWAADPAIAAERAWWVKWGQRMAEVVRPKDHIAGIEAAVAHMADLPEQKPQPQPEQPSMPGDPGEGPQSEQSGEQGEQSESQDQGAPGESDGTEGEQSEGAEGDGESADGEAEQPESETEGEGEAADGEGERGDEPGESEGQGAPGEGAEAEAEQAEGSGTEPGEGEAEGQTDEAQTDTTGQGAQAEAEGAESATHGSEGDESEPGDDEGEGEYSQRSGEVEGGDDEPEGGSDVTYGPMAEGDGTADPAHGMEQRTDALDQPLPMEPTDAAAEDDRNRDQVIGGYLRSTARQVGHDEVEVQHPAIPVGDKYHGQAESTHKQTQTVLIAPTEGEGHTHGLQPEVQGALRAAFTSRRTDRSTRSVARSGRLSGRRAHRISAGLDNVFTRRNAPSPDRLDLHLLVDASGSMAGKTGQYEKHGSRWTSPTRLEVAGTLVANITAALDHLPYVRVHVWAHNTAGGGARLWDVLDTRRGEGAKRVRTITSAGANRDASVIRALGERIIRERTSRERSVLVVFSDGAPCESVSWVRAAADSLRDKGVGVLSVAVTGGLTETQQACYDRDQVVGWTGDWDALGRDIAQHMGRLVTGR